MNNYLQKEPKKHSHSTQASSEQVRVSSCCCSKKVEELEKRTEESNSSCCASKPETTSKNMDEVLETVKAFMK